MNKKSHVFFGEMLTSDNIITIGQLSEALEIQDKQKKDSKKQVDRLGVILIRQGYLNREILETYVNKVMKSFIT